MNEFFYQPLDVVSSEDEHDIFLKKDAYSVLLNSRVVKCQSHGFTLGAVSPIMYKVTSSYRSDTYGGIFLDPNVSVYPSVVTTKREKINDLLFLHIRADESLFDAIRDINALMGSYVSTSFTMSLGLEIDGNTLDLTPHFLFVGKISNNYNPDDSQNTLDYVETLDNIVSAEIVRPTASTASLDSFLLQSLDEGSPLEGSSMSFQQAPQIEKPRFSLQQSTQTAVPTLTFQQSSKL